MNLLLRKIIHVDMDAFYTSVEQRDHPEIKGKPVAVGGDHIRGVVAAASYEARKFGVHSAMPSVTAKKKCPGLIFLPPRFDVYAGVSEQIRNIFSEYTDLVEPLSLDEAFLDVTEDKKNIRSATRIALEIKKKILDVTGLTASAGVSVNKFLAKTASDQKKPDGLFVIKPEEAEKFVENLPVEKFFGVGKVTAGRMQKMGIKTGADLKKLERKELIRLFGKTGSYYYDIARAVDHREVIAERKRKSVGAEQTFDFDLKNMTEIKKELTDIEKTLISRLDHEGFQGKTLTLKVKFANFEVITRSKTLSEAFDEKLIHTTALELASSPLVLNRGIRLLGLSVSNPVDRETVQLKIQF